MSQRYNIRWRDSDRKALANAARKFNAKRTRLLKQVPELEDFLPEKVNVQDMKKSVKTRRDLNNLLKSLDRFLVKGAEKPIVTKEGVKTTQYQKRELQIKVNAINARRRAELKKAAPSTEKGTMGTIRENNLLPKNADINKVKKSDWAKYVESVEKQSKDSYSDERIESYKKNFIKGLENAFGEKGNNLKQLAMQLSGDTLMEMYYNDPVLQIDFIYDPLEMQVKIEAMEEHLQEYLNNNII